MNLHRPLSTNNRLWQVCAAVAFVLLGFVPLWSVGKSTEAHTLWWWVWKILGELAQPEGWFLLYILGPFLAFYAIILVIPAIVFGWVVQAVIVVIRDGRSQIGQKLPATPN